MPSTHFSDISPPGRRGRLSLVSPPPANDRGDTPPATRPVCCLCGKELGKNDTVAMLEAQVYHTGCQHIENNRAAWQATRDGICLGLGAAIRIIFPHGQVEFDAQRHALRGDGPVRTSDVLTTVSCISFNLRDEARRRSASIQDRLEKELDQVARLLSDYLQGRP